MMADQKHTFCGAPLDRGHRYCVLYLEGGREKRSAWFSSPQRAHSARSVIAARHGRAIVYVD